MPQKNDPFLDLAYGWNNGEGGWGGAMNSNLTKLGFLVKGVVNSATTTTMPSPVDGEAYIVPSGGTWPVEQEGKVAYVVDGSFSYVAVENGQYVYVTDTGDISLYSEGAWSKAALISKADWPLDTEGGDAALAIYDGTISGLPNAAIITGDTSIVTSEGGTSVGGTTYGVLPTSGKVGFWYHAIQATEAGEASASYICFNAVGTEPSFFNDGDIFIELNVGFPLFAVAQNNSGSPNTILTIDNTFVANVSTAVNSVAWIGYDADTGDLRIKTAVEDVSINLPEIAGLQVNLLQIATDSAITEDEFSISQIGSIAATAGYAPLQQIGDVALPAVTAPALLSVTDDAVTGSYGGNTYGPKSDTTEGVNHFGFLMPDGSTVIPLPDDAVGRAEVIARIEAAIASGEAYTDQLRTDLNTDPSVTPGAGTEQVMHRGGISAADAIDSKLDATSDSLLLDWAYTTSFRLISGTRDSNGALTSANISWPDGATGTFTADAVSTSFPGAIDAWHATHVLNSVTKTITQTVVTRDSNGAVTAQPAITIS